MHNVSEPKIENNEYLQLEFCKDKWNTVINTDAHNRMVCDVADESNPNPPENTFYLFSFHERHNQQYIYKYGIISAKQNGQVVTYIGCDEPLVNILHLNLINPDKH